MNFRLVQLTLFLVAFLSVNSVLGQELTLDKIFPIDRVIDIKITVDKKDWESIRYVKRDLRAEFAAKRQFAPIDSPYKYVKGDIVIDGVEFPGVGIRKKGFLGSQSSDRPSFKVKLDFTDTKAEIDGLSSLTLNNNQQDTSLLSQFMGYAFFQSAGLPAPRCAFAHVTFNGEDFGVYCHVESARKPLAQNGFGNSTGTLYEGTVNDFYKDWELSFDKKFGNDKYGRKQIKAAIDALKVPTGQKKEDFDVEASIGEFVDMDAFYKFWAVEGLLGFWDGYSGNRNNFFIYVNPDDDKIYFLPWGGDCMFQKYSMIDRDRRLPVSVKTTGLLAYRLYQTPSGRNRYRETLLAVLEHDWQEEELLKEIDRIESLVKPFLSRSQQRTVKSDSVRKFIRTRRQEIMEEIADGMPDWNRAPGPPPVIPDGSRLGRKKSAEEKAADIWTAAKNGDTELIVEQLKKGIKADARDPNGTTPLIMAALGGKTEAAQILLANGADVNAKSNDSNTAIHSAAFLGHLEIVKLLVKHKVELNSKNRDGSTPLDAASTRWQDVKEFAGMIDQMLDLKLDLSRMSANRGAVTEFLKASGAKTGR